MLFGQSEHFAKRAGAFSFFFLFSDFLLFDFYLLGLFLSLLEFFNFAKRVHILHFTSKKWMTIAADFHANLGDGCPGCKSIAASADDFGIIEILRMNSLFHSLDILPPKQQSINFGAEDDFYVFVRP